MAALTGKADVFELDILKLIFNATNISLLADNTVTTPLTNLFVALHTADPLEAGDQTSNEATYTNYTRIAVARTSGGWTCATAAGVSTAINAATITFPACGVTGNTVTHVTIGTVTSGASKILYGGALTSSLAISNGITPSFAAGQLSVSED